MRVRVLTALSWRRCLRAQRVGALGSGCIRTYVLGMQMNFYLE